MSAALTRTVTQQQIEAYAGASGDHNPVHVDPAFAAGTPFGGTIAHGMLVLAFVGQALHATYGDPWLRAGRLKVRFKAPTRPGDTVAVQLEPSVGGEGAAYDVRVRNQHGENLVEGRASVAGA